MWNLQFKASCIDFFSQGKDILLPYFVWNTFRKLSKICRLTQLPNWKWCEQASKRTLDCFSFSQEDVLTCYLNQQTSNMSVVWKITWMPGSLLHSFTHLFHLQPIENCQNKAKSTLVSLTFLFLLKAFCLRLATVTLFTLTINLIITVTWAYTT